MPLYISELGSLITEQYDWETQDEKEESEKATTAALSEILNSKAKCLRDMKKMVNQALYYEGDDGSEDARNGAEQASNSYIEAKGTLGNRDHSGILERFFDPEELEDWVSGKDLDYIEVPSPGSKGTDKEKGTAAWETYLDEVRRSHPKVCEAIETDGQSLANTFEFSVDTCIKFLIARMNLSQTDSDVQYRGERPDSEEPVV